MPSGLSTSRGIAQGLEKATGNIMSIMAAKSKLEQEKERNKVDSSYKNAQLKKMEFDVSEAEGRARREKDMYQKIFGDRQSFGAGYKAGGGVTEQQNQVDYRDVLPPGVSYRSGDITIKGGKELQELTPYQKSTLAEKDEEKRVQKSNALDFIDQLVNESSQSGKLTSKGKKYKYSPDLIKRAVQQRFKNIDVRDPDIVNAIPSSIDPATTRERNWGVQKFPRKQHPSNGRTYERREDGKWHLLGE